MAAQEPVISLVGSTDFRRQGFKRLSHVSREIYGPFSDVMGQKLTLDWSDPYSAYTNAEIWSFGQLTKRYLTRQLALRSAEDQYSNPESRTEKGKRIQKHFVLIKQQVSYLTFCVFQKKVVLRNCINHERTIFTVTMNNTAVVSEGHERARQNS